MKTTVTPLERNRVSLRFDIEEGAVTKIADINIIGAKDFSEKELLRTMKLTTPGWFTWFTKDDQYSKQQLTADLESAALVLPQPRLPRVQHRVARRSRSRPTARRSTSPSPSPRARSTTSATLKLAGDLIVPEAELRALLILAKPGDVFSREKIVDSTKRITDRLGNDGYSFANVNPVPDLDREKRIASFTFFVDPGRRVYVRRVNISGNTKTQDEVIRRELRQLESSWYSLEKIARSKERLQRTGVLLGREHRDARRAGHLGPGGRERDRDRAQHRHAQLRRRLLRGGEAHRSRPRSRSPTCWAPATSSPCRSNSGAVDKVYSFSYLNPYWTPDGISRGFDIFERNVDTSLARGGRVPDLLDAALACASASR